MYSNYYKSPVGDILVKADDEALLYLAFADGRGHERTETTPLIGELFAQLDEYFAGQRREFDMPLKMYGTIFQQAVWAALMQIPYGRTVSYGQLAAMIGRPSASRAVGGANHNNPISIIVPCHRVVGSTGKLTGYGGGLDKKAFLLELEKHYK